jgi:ABC-type amino acid transport system permease subunit
MNVSLRRRNAMPRFAGAMAVASVAMIGAATPASAAGGGFLGSLSMIRTVASTVPANGDVNPYGVAVVPTTTGRLTRGDVLVSNFNNSTNAQGTGTTIVEVTPAGHRTTFARISQSQVPGGVGLTTALVALRSGWVIVGNLPTTNGMSATATAGSLLVIDSMGRLREIWTGHGINGPWDATAADFGDHAALFVTNVLNGTVAHSPATVFRGTVLRLRVSLTSSMPTIVQTTMIGSGFPERTDPAALVIGPTGVALARNGTLYVADTLRSRIAAIPFALTRSTSAGDGATVRSGSPLNGPLGLTAAPNGDLVSVNSGDGRAVEVSPGGALVATKWLDRSGMPPGAGALFGLAVAPGGAALYFVDDATNTLDLLH